MTLSFCFCCTFLFFYETRAKTTMSTVSCMMSQKDLQSCNHLSDFHPDARDDFNNVDLSKTSVLLSLENQSPWQMQLRGLYTQLLS